MVSASGVYSVQGPCCFSDVCPKLLPMWVHRTAVLVCHPFVCQPKKKEKEKNVIVQLEDFCWVSVDYVEWFLIMKNSLVFFGDNRQGFQTVGEVVRYEKNASLTSVARLLSRNWPLA